MAREFAAEFYSSGAWKRARDDKAKSAGGLCEMCLSRGIIEAGEIVHHIQPLTPENINDASISLNPENLIFLCRECHAECHSENKRYVIGPNGEIISRRGR